MLISNKKLSESIKNIMIHSKTIIIKDYKTLFRLLTLNCKKEKTFFSKISVKSKTPKMDQKKVKRLKKTRAKRKIPLDKTSSLKSNLLTIVWKAFNKTKKKNPKSNLLNRVRSKDPQKTKEDRARAKTKAPIYPSRIHHNVQYH